MVYQFFSSFQLLFSYFFFLSLTFGCVAPPLFRIVERMIAKTPEEAAVPQIWLASAPHSELIVHSNIGKEKKRERNDKRKKKKKKTNKEKKTKKLLNNPEFLLISFQNGGYYKGVKILASKSTHAKDPELAEYLWNWTSKQIKLLNGEELKKK